METPKLDPVTDDGMIFVLVVEDEFLLRFAVADALRSFGLSVVEAANATEAWRYLESGGRVDIVFSASRCPVLWTDLNWLAGFAPSIQRSPSFSRPGTLPRKALTDWLPLWANLTALRTLRRAFLKSCDETDEAT